MKLQQLQIFQNLTEEELEKSLVCSQAVVKKYPKDTYIFRQGDVPLKLYFILEGMVELGSINLNGKIIKIKRERRGAAPNRYTAVHGKVMHHNEVHCQNSRELEIGLSWCLFHIFGVSHCLSH